MYRKIVVASDSFKGSLTSLEVADSAERGVHEVFPDCEVVKVNVADGGEGTMEALRQTLGGKVVHIDVSDPLGRLVSAPYVILDDGITAVLEMSAASGLTLLRPDERNPMRTSTYGTGQLIADALSKGCRKFLVGIGGSATNDAGMGMMRALGCRFLDAEGKELDGTGSSLINVEDIDVSCLAEGLNESEFIVACDVDSPFYGPKGAAFVFSPQKGADRDMVDALDKGLEHFASVVRHVMGRDVAEIPGAGAAGGLGGGFLAFTNARLERGVEMVLDAIGFDNMIRSSDLVITGEGRVDFQTLTGKTPYGVLKRARKQNIPVIAIGGSVTLSDEEVLKAGFAGAYAVTPAGMPLEEAMKADVASHNVTSAVASILKKSV